MGKGINDLLNILKELSLKGIYCSINYHNQYGQYYIDLQTGAKSDLHLFDCGTIRGRYEYINTIDFEQNMDIIITHLCYEFKTAMCGKDYGALCWIRLCDELNIN